MTRAAASDGAWEAGLGNNKGQGEDGDEVVAGFLDSNLFWNIELVIVFIQTTMFIFFGAVFSFLFLIQTDHCFQFELIIVLNLNGSLIQTDHFL